MQRNQTKIIKLCIHTSQTSHAHVWQIEKRKITIFIEGIIKEMWEQLLLIWAFCMMMVTRKGKHFAQLLWEVWKMKTIFLLSSLSAPSENSLRIFIYQAYVCGWNCKEKIHLYFTQFSENKGIFVELKKPLLCKGMKF